MTAAAVAVGLLPLVATPATAEVSRPGGGDAIATAGQAPAGVGAPGGAGAAGRDGDFTYSVPITVPPGRKGQQPGVALSYASSGATHGNVAAGWSLGMPAIMRDPEAGTISPEALDVQLPPDAVANFVGPGGVKLTRDLSLPVTTGAKGYRAVGDPTFTRYEFLGDVAGAQHWWRTFTSNGTLVLYGLKSQHPASYAPIVSVLDGDGHELRYNWLTVGRTSGAVPAEHPREFLLTGIDYRSPGASSPYAKVTFTYAEPAYCGDPTKALPLGSILDYRLGFGRLSGTRKLTNIQTHTANAANDGFVLNRDYLLNYDSTDSCSSGGTTPFRQLASVAETAYSPNMTGPGSTTVMPPVRFTYGKAAAYVMDQHYETATTVANLRVPESIDTMQAGRDGQRFNPDEQFVRCGPALCPAPGISGDPEPPSGNDFAWHLARAQSSGESVSTMYLDINGDGLQDMLRLPEQVNLARYQPELGNCRVDVYLNRGSAGMVKNDPEFSHFSLRDAIADVPSSSPAGSDGSQDLLCSLSRTLSNNASGGWLGNPDERCSDHWSARTEWGSMQQIAHSFQDINGDRKPDLISQTIASRKCPYRSTWGVPWQNTSPLDPAYATQKWSWEHIRPSGESFEVDTVRQRYFYIYRNTGSGFDTTPTRVDAPAQSGYPRWAPLFGCCMPSVKVARVAQPTVIGGYSMSGAASETDYRLGQMLADVTGDGYPDYVESDIYDGADRVYLGRQDGGFRDSYPIPEVSDGEELTPGLYRRSIPSGYIGYQFAGTGHDVNGDGLPDITTLKADGTRVKFNKGYHFGSAADGGESMFSQGSTMSKDLSSYVNEEWSSDWQRYPTDSSRHGRTGMVDLDYDGLPDQFHFSELDVSKVFLNGGVSWVRELSASPGVMRAVAGQVADWGPAVQAFADRGDYRHTASHQAIDVNGDGLLDLVEDVDGDGEPVVRFAKQVLDTADAVNAPARLLRTIDNGAGAKTRVTYAHSTTAHKFVVDEISLDPGQGEARMSTRHAYKASTYMPGAYGQVGFHGFREVRVLKVGDPATTADDLTSVTLYAYDKDHRGLPTRMATVLGRAAFDNAARFDQYTGGGVMTLVDSDYHVKELGKRVPSWVASFPSRTVLPKSTTSYICSGASGQTVAACLAGGAKHSTDTEYTSHTVDGAYVLEKVAASEVRFTNGQGKVEVRKTTPTVNVAWSANVFNVAPATTATEVSLDGTATQVALVQHSYYDAEFRQPKNTTTTDLLGGSSARTSRVQYYGGTGANRGLVYRSWAPEQVQKYGNTNSAAGYSEFTYDVHGVTTTRVKSPVRTYEDGENARRTVHHIVDTVVDRGTGATLETRGPDYVCPDDSGDTDPGTQPDPPSNCSVDQAAYRERVEVKVDGFGRMRSTVKYPAGSQSGVEIARSSYNDNAAFSSNGAAPVSMTTETASGDGEFAHSTKEVDGLGRVVRTVTKQDNSPDRVNTYDYDASGNNHQSFTPRADNAPGAVGVLTTFDPLARVLTTAEIGGREFSRHTYDGLTHTISQVTSNADDGLPATTRTTTDAIGQLVKVEEATSPTAWATTTYTSGGVGRSTITDPDGVATTIVTDGFGQRRSITTATKTWSYEYDRNGNATATTEPRPANTDVLAYTHRSEYDDANRLVKEIPAHRGMDSQKLAEFKITPKVYGYDGASNANDPATKNVINHIGRLSWTDSGAVRLVNQYDAFGNPLTAKQTAMALDGVVLPNGGKLDTLQANSTVAPSGIVENLEYRAHSPAGQLTHDGPTVTFDHDRDGVPLAASWRFGNKDMTIRNARNAAGAIVSRVGNANGTTGWVSPQFLFDHDRFGRPTAITAKVGATQRYRQTLSYRHNGEIGQVTEQLGGTAKPVATTTYRYDHRQQLLSADQATTPDTPDNPARNYAAQFTHTAGGRMASANVALTGQAEEDGSRVHARNVTYAYNTADPQQLDHLRKVGDNSNLATYLYDAMGNTTSRTLPDGTVVQQEWDGTRLRKVTRPGGGSETYFYDGASRVAAVHRNADGSLNTVRRWFGSLEAIHQPGKAVTYRQGISLGGAVVARHDGNDTTGTTEHVLTSPQGHHVLALRGTDASTMRVASYGAFGEVLSEFANPANLPAFDKYTEEFNGKTYDGTAGLHYYGHRYYDPLALQWISSDPLFRHNPDLQPANPRSANLYTYTDNNPVGKVDPNGLCATCGFQAAAEYVYAAHGTGYNQSVTNYYFQQGLESAVIAYGQGMLSVAPIVSDVYDIYQFVTAETWAERAYIAAGFLVGGAVDSLFDLARRGSRTAVMELDRAGALGRSGAGSGGDPSGTVIAGDLRYTGGATVGDGRYYGGAALVPTSGKISGEARLRWNGYHMEVGVKKDGDGETWLNTELLLDISPGAAENATLGHRARTRTRWQDGSEFYSVMLPDAGAAQIAQTRSIGADLGAYKLGVNDCITYCGNILRAGGLTPPRSGGDIWANFTGTAMEAWLKTFGTKVDSAY